MPLRNTSGTPPVIGLIFPRFTTHHDKLKAEDNAPGQINRHYMHDLRH